MSKQTTTKTTSKSSLKSTIESKRLTKCYTSSKGTLNGINYRKSLTETECTTSCGSTQIKNNTELLDINGCDTIDTICNEYPMFQVKNNHTYKLACCKTNLCNTPEFLAKSLNFNCESYKQVTKSMKLTFKTRYLNAQSVKQCYFCNNCTKETEIKISNCAKLYPELKNQKFACGVRTFSHF